MPEKPDKPEPDQNLQDLLRQQSGSKTPAANLKPSANAASRPSKKNPGSDLQEQLARVSGAPPSQHRAAQQATKANTDSQQPSVQELLHASEPGHEKGNPKATTKGVSTTPSNDNLQELLTGAPSAKKLAPANAAGYSNASAKAAGLNHPTKQEVKEKQPAPSPGGKRVKTARQHDAQAAASGQKRLGIALILLCSISAGVWMYTALKPAETQPNVLIALAQGAEEYRRLNGSYPEHLSGLDTFPEHALEWPLHYWEARNAHGLAEIFWVNEGTRFQIIIRIGSEAWLYDHDGRVRSVPAD